ncbi:MAG: hypothetical protein JXB88_16475 [Spirochaetales bacterium]|nr:hypothetical protein [Spirochaetales bacterium]
MKRYYIQVKQENNEPLLSLLTGHLHLDREEAVYLISTGAVWNKNTNTRLKNPNQLLAGELIVVHKPSYQVPVYQFDPGHIIYEEQGFSIVYKMGKYPTVPTPYSDVNSLSHALNHYYRKKQPGINVSVINRLDTHTRGLVFCAKNKNMEKTLHRMFQQRMVKKWYFAGTEVFPGVKENYVIQDSLEWKGKQRSAGTFIHLMKQDKDRYCFLVRPYTGRTHQIRKHFATYLVPLWGDPVYGHFHRDSAMALVCFAYIFPHPVTGKRMKVMYLPNPHHPLPAV